MKYNPLPHRYPTIAKSRGGYLARSKLSRSCARHLVEIVEVRNPHRYLVEAIDFVLPEVSDLVA